MSDLERQMRDLERQWIRDVANAIMTEGGLRDAEVARLKEEHAVEMAEVEKRAVVAEAEVKIKTDIIA
eukprot:2281584-Rhodomonas_salina.1